MLKKILTGLVLSGYLFLLQANELSLKNEIYSLATLLDKKYNIDKKIILAYIKTESNFELYPILITSKEPDFANMVFKELGYKTKKGKKHISIHPKDYESAEFLYDFLQVNKKNLSITDYDFGIMQLNTRTIKNYGVDEKTLYLDYRKNMLYGADIIRGCYEVLKDKTKIYNVIECYNRGVSIKHLEKSPRTYLNRFMENYDNL